MTFRPFIKVEPGCNSNTVNLGLIPSLPNIKQEHISPIKQERMSPIKQEWNIKREPLPHPSEIKNEPSSSSSISSKSFISTKKPIHNIFKPRSQRYDNRNPIPQKHRGMYSKLSPYLRSAYWNLPRCRRRGFLNSLRDQHDPPFEIQCETARQSIYQSVLQHIPCENPPQPTFQYQDLTTETLEPWFVNWKKNHLFKIGIWDQFYMSAEKISALKRALIMAIMADATNTTVPRIYDCIEQRGWLQISCKDTISRQWVSDVVEVLKPWPEARLRSKPCDEVENYVVTKLTVDYADARTVEEMIVLLKRQNYGFTTDKWRINNVYHGTESMMVEFSLTDGQLHELRAADYKPTVGFGRAIVQFKY